MIDIFYLQNLIEHEVCPRCTGTLAIGIAQRAKESKEGTLDFATLQLGLDTVAFHRAGRRSTASTSASMPVASTAAINTGASAAS
jgi:hypothetical protein